MSSPLRVPFLLFPVFFGAASLGCEAECDTGDEGCECYGNGSCNGTLSCRSDVCVALTSSEGGDGDGSGVDLDACFDCAEGACPNEVSECRATDGCEDFVDCVVECGANQSCQTGCTESRSAEAQANAVLLTACAFVACSEECVGTPQSPAVGQPGNPAPGPAGPPPGEPFGPGDPVEPTVPGPGEPAPAPEVTLVSGTNWLALDGSGAPSSAVPNSLLGIEGVFYAYGDECATYTWNDTARCISGTHCAPSAANWGVGIGFDFYNDGTSKTTWSAAEHSARAVQWSVSGSSSSSGVFQVWLTNMDSSYGTSCGASLDCAIAGPPDGTAFPGYMDALYFENLSKDDWGGTGVAYSFNPARLLSVQFKIPSSSVNTSFALCIDRFGLVL